MKKIMAAVLISIVSSGAFAKPLSKYSEAEITALQRGYNYNIAMCMWNEIEFSRSAGTENNVQMIPDMNNDTIEFRFSDGTRRICTMGGYWEISKDGSRYFTSVSDEDYDSN